MQRVGEVLDGVDGDEALQDRVVVAGTDPGQSGGVFGAADKPAFTCPAGGWGAARVPVRVLPGGGQGPELLVIWWWVVPCQSATRVVTVSLEASSLGKRRLSPELVKSSV